MKKSDSSINNRRFTSADRLPQSRKAIHRSTTGGSQAQIGFRNQEKRFIDQQPAVRKRRSASAIKKSDSSINNRRFTSADRLLQSRKTIHRSTTGGSQAQIDSCNQEKRFIDQQPAVHKLRSTPAIKKNDSSINNRRFTSSDRLLQSRKTIHRSTTGGSQAQIDSCNQEKRFIDQQPAVHKLRSTPAIKKND